MKGTARPASWLARRTRDGGKPGPDSCQLGLPGKQPRLVVLKRPGTKTQGCFPLVTECAPGHTCALLGHQCQLGGVVCKWNTVQLGRKEQRDFPASESDTPASQNPPESLLPENPRRETWAPCCDSSQGGVCGDKTSAVSFRVS